MKEATPVGKHSIGHKTGLLGAGMSMPIIDPSTFHGYSDSLQPYIDWIRIMGEEKVGDEECDVIEGLGDLRAVRRCAISKNYMRSIGIKVCWFSASTVRMINR